MPVSLQYNLGFNPIWYFRDKYGQPAVKGELYTTRASAPDEPKLVYQDPEHTLPLPYPVPLNDVGACSNKSGATVPLYFANDEDYCLVAKDAAGNIIYQQNPYNSPVNDQPQPVKDELDIKNYILNSQYRYYVQKTFSNTDLTAGPVLLAADGWYFRKNEASDTINTIEFKPFPLGQTDVPHNPPNYLRFSCSGIGVAGDSYKDIYFRIADVSTFANQIVTWGAYLRAQGAMTCQMFIMQDFGTGGTPSEQVPTIIGNVTLNPTFGQYEFTFTVPSVAGKTLGTNGDDSLWIGLRMPLSQLCIIDMVNWQKNRSNVLLGFDYKDEDLDRMDRNAYALPDPTDQDIYSKLVWDGSKYIFENDTGLVIAKFANSVPGHLLVDGSAYKTLDYVPGTKVKYRRLFDHWEGERSGNMFGFGAHGFIYAGAYTNTMIFFDAEAETAITDWADHNTGFTFSKIRAGSDLRFTTLSAFALAINKNTIQVQNKDVGAVSHFDAGTSGATGTVIQNGDASHVEITNISIPAASGLAGKYFKLYTPAGGYYPWFKVDGVGTDPAVPGLTGICIELWSSWAQDSTTEITRLALSGHQQNKIATVAASALTGGQYCFINNATEQYVLYIVKDGVGDDPKIAGKISVPVNISTGDDAIAVLQKFSKEVRAIYFQLPPRGFFLRSFDPAGLIDVDVLQRFNAGDLMFGAFLGTRQWDQFESHNHQPNPGFQFVEQCPESWGGTSHGPIQYIGANTTGNAGGSESRPANLAINFFVKF